MSDVMENTSVETPEIPEIEVEAVVAPDQVRLMPTKVSLANNMVNTAQTMLCGMIITGVANLALTGAKAVWKGGKRLLADHKEKRELRKLAEQVNNAQEQPKEAASEEE